MPLNSTLESRASPRLTEARVRLHRHGVTVRWIYWNTAVIDYLA